MFSNMLFAAVDSTNMTASPEALGGIIALIAGMALLAGIVGVALYIYTALAFQTIGKKLKYKKAWLAWIPIANYAMILELGGFHWALIFLLLVPVLGWAAVMVLALISMWRIFEKRKYPGWLALVPILAIIPIVNIFVGIAYLVIIGLVAWKDR
ncbi:hypothetical protein GW835_01360 [archaeon]|nr:hypothetical protein [archaeon]NCP79199.1 hypothetical protein [archaeon]NCP97854.1 hypothetical protein [archaeon]NCQ06966.1 hypothetical protein [archaeon]NCQ50762.1 hypothetical protein [archaeon]